MRHTNQINDDIEEEKDIEEILEEEEDEGED